MNARCKPRPILAGTAQVIALMSLLTACGSSNIIEPFDTSITLLEYQTYTFKARYRDKDGLPIAAASLRFSIKPTHADGNGAMFASGVAVTGEDGVASAPLQVKSEANFYVEIDADDAEEPGRVNVAVSKDSGGRIDVSIYQASAVEVIEAEVLLVDDLECANFDEYEPPPATTKGMTTKQTVAIEPGKASNTMFLGLTPNITYAVVAIGRASGQVVARGCRDGLSITADMIDQKRGLSVALDLEDRLPPIRPSELSVITKFKNNLALTGFAGLLRSLAGKRYGPAEYILNQMLYRSDDSNLMQRIFITYRAELVSMLGGSNGAQNGSMLIQAADALNSVEDVQLHSRMSIADETQDGVVTGEFQIKHRMHSFTAVIQSGNGQMLRREFPLLALVKPPNGVRPVVFSDTPIKLEATATIRVEDASRVSISAHQMSLPITDAIVGQVLADHFGKSNLTDIIKPMIACDEAGRLADSIFQQMGLYGSRNSLTQSMLGRLIGGFLDGGLTVSIRVAFTKACERIITDIVAAIQRQATEDLSAFRADKDITFVGSANMMLLSDGVTINWLKNGNWTGEGTFEATR